MNLISKILRTLLYPFIILIETVLNYSYRVSGNYGAALILLSFFITTITAPLYYLAEKWKNQEKIVQKKMHKDIQSITTNFEGQKDFILLKPLGRFITISGGIPLGRLSVLLFKYRFSLPLMRYYRTIPVISIFRFYLLKI